MKEEAKIEAERGAEEEEVIEGEIIHVIITKKRSLGKRRRIGRNTSSRETREERGSEEAESTSDLLGWLRIPTWIITGSCQTISFEGEINCLETPYRKG